MTIQQALELALQLHGAGRLAEGETILRQILAVDPRHAPTLNLLGLIAHQTGRKDAAVEALSTAVAVNPFIAAWHNHLGVALRAVDRSAEAVASYQRAIALEPHFAEAHSNLGNALKDLGQLDEAIAACRRALALKPDLAQAWNNLGTALKDQGQIDEAIGAYGRALTLKPDFAEAHNNLGNAQKDQGQLDEAIASYRRALQLKPDYPEAHNNLGCALGDRCEHGEAIAEFRRALELNPNLAQARSSSFSSLLYLPEADAEMMFREYGRWDELHARPLAGCIQPFTNGRDPERRLRVGYVSGDFREHPAAVFLESLLAAHDREQVDVFCYANVRRPDAVTARLRAHAARWHDIPNLPDAQVAELIRSEGVDILVDLSGHTAHHRLFVFARKPAPVQVTWLGYPGSTGLRTMDYRLTDAILEPEGCAWCKSVETPVRLRDSWFCFDPVESYPEPGELPALQAGYVTFACLNNFAKVNDGVLKLWAKVLSAVEDSRLLLQCPAGVSQSRVRKLFEAQGIAPHRLELITRTATRAEFLALFAQIDIALDPFPYNGGTTTCEALWMGVPVPAFPGSTAISRLGLSILSAAGLQELAAASEADYQRLVVSLATDLPRLASLRATLRQRMKASTFMDAPRFARNVEQAYREMWRRWCSVGY